jgi:hypothetical protein
VLQLAQYGALIHHVLNLLRFDQRSLVHHLHNDNSKTCIQYSKRQQQKHVGRELC